jgi:hypothetical protein
MITKRRKPSKFDVKRFSLLYNKKKTKKYFVFFLKKNRPSTLDTEGSVIYSVSRVILYKFFGFDLFL